MKNKLIWLEALLVLVPFLALLALWKDLPDRVPVHWNLHGQIDGWSSKPSLFIMPVFSLGTMALLHFLPRIDPKLRRTPDGQGRMQKVLAIFRLTLATFFALIFFMVLTASLGHPVPASRIVPGSILLLLAIFGNYFSNLRPNYFAGIRTPWTLESPATWRATHRLAGRVLFFGSLTLLVLQFFVSERVFAPLLFSSVLLWAAWAVWYSWHHFNTQGATAVHSPTE
jgi:uncharacterized membrane protein